MKRPVITFLTDFGLDGAAAVCRGVMLGICGDAQIIDIAHTIRKYAIGDASFLLRMALPYMPVGVHVAVVDPGVGTERRPIAVRVARGDVLIAPDNGLLPPVAEVLGGAAEARVLENRELWLPGTSATFHGRDIFSPVAARLAAGDAAFEAVGPAMPLAKLVELPSPRARAADGALETEVTYVDSFGNVRLAGALDDLRGALGALDEMTPLHVEFHDGDGAPRREETRFARTFGRVPLGSSLLYVDSSGNLALADNQGNAAARLEVAPGRRASIRRP